MRLKSQHANFPAAFSAIGSHAFSGIKMCLCARVIEPSAEMNVYSSGGDFVTDSNGRPAGSEIQSKIE